MELQPDIWDTALGGNGACHWNIKSPFTSLGSAPGKISSSIDWFADKRIAAYRHAPMAHAL